MNYNSDFRHDLEVGQVSEKELGDIFENKTVEVKRDLKARASQSYTNEAVLHNVQGGRATC